MLVTADGLPHWDPNTVWPVNHRDILIIDLRRVWSMSLSLLCIAHLTVGEHIACLNSPPIVSTRAIHTWRLTSRLIISLNAS